jgi:hypothetical protein
MHADEIRFLFAYDGWATRRVLVVLDGLDPAVWTRRTWSASGVWAPSSTAISAPRSAGATRSRPRRLSSSHGRRSTQLRERRDAEWAAIDAWLPTVTDGFVAHVHEGVLVWQMLVHVVNHGTQHRAEAAALITVDGSSPGDLDLINYAEEQVDGSTES